VSGEGQFDCFSCARVQDPKHHCRPSLTRIGSPKPRHRPFMVSGLIRGKIHLTCQKLDNSALVLYLSAHERYPGGRR
jgi:hypothetical protein